MAERVKRGSTAATARTGGTCTCCAPRPDDKVGGRLGGSDGQQVTQYFDREHDARTMLQRTLDTTPAIGQLREDDAAAEESLSRLPHAVQRFHPRT